MARHMWDMGCDITGWKSVLPFLAFWKTCSNIQIIFSFYREFTLYQIFASVDKHLLIISNKYLYREEKNLYRFSRVKCHIACGTGTSHVLQLNHPNVTC